MLSDRGARVYNGERTVSSINRVGKTIATCKRTKVDHYLTLHTKSNSKNRLNVRPKTIKLLEENISCKFFDTGLDNFFACVSSGKGNKTKWDYIKLKSFCTVKETINEVKRPLTELQKI